ncbi:hypothetical protein AC1031_012861 [Aphanomyces cochlioides]|nr:hypothetical protein AC1031_012861 [Aphanomyces cochlioides]
MFASGSARWRMMSDGIHRAMVDYPSAQITTRGMDHPLSAESLSCSKLDMHCRFHQSAMTRAIANFVGAAVVIHALMAMSKRVFKSVDKETQKRLEDLEHSVQELKEQVLSSTAKAL